MRRASEAGVCASGLCIVPFGTRRHFAAAIREFVNGRVAYRNQSLRVVLNRENRDVSLQLVNCQPVA